MRGAFVGTSGMKSSEAAARMTRCVGAAVTCAASVLALGMVPGAWAQVVTPPPAEVPVPSEFEPKTPPPVAPAPPPMPRQINPNAANPASPANPRANRPRLADIPLPDMPYASLVIKKADGTILPLDTTVDLAALRVNPMLDEAERAEMAGYLAERAAAFERIALDNIDIIDQIENGLFDTVNWVDRESSGPVIKSIRPLMPPQAPRNLAAELESRNFLDIQEKAFNAKIAKEYRDAIATPRPGQDAPKEEVEAHTRRTISSTMRDTLDESIRAYRALMIEAAPRTGDILKAMDLPADLAERVTPLATAVSMSTTDDRRLQAMRELFRPMSPEQRKAFLEKSVSMRK